MTAKPVIPGLAALAEADAAIDYYLAEAGPGIALSFIAALESAYRFIGENPAAGSPGWADKLGLPGLRSWNLKKFPWIVFYVERSSHIDVARLLHDKRDIPATLQQSQD